MTEARKPIDAALDLLVYVPVGLAVTAAEELPKLAAKGRSRVTTQLTMARVVGQFALSRGRSLIEQRIEQVASTPPRSAAPGYPNGGSAGDGDLDGGADGVPLTYDELIASQPAGRSSRGHLRPVPSSGERDGTSGEHPASVVPARGAAGTEPAPDALSPTGTAERAEPVVTSPGGGVEPAGPSGAHEAATSLAIPGYDSLSASQVVQRLAGLSGEELAAVGAYEEAHRGRRTILNRVSQLQGQ